MRQTENLGLALYDASDKMNVTGAENSLNHNMELIDAELVRKVTAPETGSTGQVLTKTDAGYAWQNVPDAATINDDAAEAGSTWSSQKIAQEVGAKLDQETFDQVFYIEDASVNLYAPTNDGWLETSTILSSGAIRTGTTGDEAYCVTPKIPLEGGKTYTVSPNLTINSMADVNRMRCYTDADLPTDVMTLTKNDDDSITFTTPAGAAYIRFTVHVYNYAGHSDFSYVIPKFSTSFMLVEGTELPEAYVPYAPAMNTLKNIDIPDQSVKLSKLDADAAAVIAPLKGKTIANFGDSIFGNARPPQDISTMLAARTGATVYNCAFGGCRMGPHSGHWDAFSMYRLAAAIAANDYSVQDDALGYEDRTSYAEEPLAAIKSIDFSTLDVMTIAYGVNDFGGGNPVDNADDPLDTATMCGALRYSIETLLTAFPQLRIFILLPTYSYRMDSDGAFTEDTDTIINGLGKTLAEYSHALADVAKVYKLPVIDNYHELGVNRLNREQYLADGAHHNDAGRNLLADHIAHALW